MFKWACPIGYAEIVLMGLAKSPVNIAKLEDAEKYNIGAVRADVGSSCCSTTALTSRRS